MSAKNPHTSKLYFRHYLSILIIGVAFLLAASLTGFVAWFSLVREPQLIREELAHIRMVQDEPLKLQLIRQSVQPPKPIASPPHDTVIPPVVNGIAPVISQLDTKEPIVFLTIDDGAIKQQAEIDTILSKHIKASLFLANLFVQDDPGFFKGFLPGGSLIEDHTITHPDLRTLSLAEQKQEICGEADLQQKEYGRRPVLFRPPGGNYNFTTQEAAAACGMQAVVLWHAKANGGSMQYQIGDSLLPGDIVLMHFRPLFQQDLQAFLDAANAAHLRIELLEDWLAK
jgi:peptidoglycan/xylan/chitin deacetylase (PgdA/CDA1 family)